MVNRLPDVFAIPSEVKTTSTFSCSRDLVLIRNELTPPAKWPPARVIAIHPGRDRITRVVDRQSGRQRWAECSGLSVQAPDAESISSPLAIYDARERAAPLSALRASLYRPPIYIYVMMADGV